MTLAMHNSSAQPLPDFARLVPLPLAAARLGKNRGHLRRVCVDELQYKGLAIFTKSSDGGQAQWFVHRDYDPRLIDDGGANWTEPDLAGFTLRQREDAIKRRECVKALLAARASRPGAVKDWLPRLIDDLNDKFSRRDSLGARVRNGFHVSRSSLFEWENKYQRPADLVKLIDERGGDKRGATSGEAWSAFADHFLHENQPSKRQVWKIVADLARENGWTWCSYDSCKRQVDKRIAPEVQTKHREPAKWRSSMKPTIAQDPEAWRAGECWIGDHKQLDLICRFNDSLIRPWLTTWMDWRTRRVVGYVLSDAPNSTTILAALRHGLKDERNLGGPRHVWIDNGRDYDAWLFHGQTKKQRRSKAAARLDEPRAHGIFAMLQIEPHFSIPENPNGKGRLERWFKTLEDFSRLFDTYTGRDIESKPERLKEILATAHRIPSFEQIHDRIAQHISGYNACDDHARRDLRDDNGELLSPDEAMARWCDTRYVMRDEKSLDLLLMHWHKPVTVGKDGIAISIRGRTLHFGQFNPALTPFKAPSKSRRRPVIIAFDPHDLRSVRVHDEVFRYVCTAELNGMGGQHGRDALSVEHVAEMNRQQATYTRSLKHVAEHSLTTCLTSEERLADVAAQSRRKKTAARAAEPSRLRIRQTPIDGQAAAIERDQIKVAVGAESMQSPTSRALPSPSELLRRINHSPRPRAADSFVHPLDQLRERRR